MGLFLLGSGCQFFLHDDFIVAEGLMDIGCFVVAGGGGLEAFEGFHVLGMFFQSPDKAFEVVLHVLFDPVVLVDLLRLHVIVFLETLLDRRVAFELDFHFGLFDDQI